MFMDLNYICFFHGIISIIDIIIDTYDIPCETYSNFELNQFHDEKVESERLIVSEESLCKFQPNDLNILES